jgi:catechol 2,3-dioxygenase-like lactoylglutathione lyase family enzyme
MRVRGLNHFNVTASAEVIEKVRDFYVEVLGLSVGDRPGFRREGFWLYAGSEPVVHLTTEDADDIRTPNARSTFDHVALSCEGLREFVERLERAGVEYGVDEVASLGQVQLSLRDPAGVGLELNFAGESFAPEGSA